MKLFFANIYDAVKYALSDKKGIVIISALLAITSLINKNGSLNPFWRLFTVTLLIVMGYGPYVSWHTLKGSDEHPKINNLKKLIWPLQMMAVTSSYPTVKIVDSPHQIHLLNKVNLQRQKMKPKYFILDR